jgi:hypothetical protein
MRAGGRYAELFALQACNYQVSAGPVVSQ